MIQASPIQETRAPAETQPADKRSLNGTRQGESERSIEQLESVPDLPLESFLEARKQAKQAYPFRCDFRAWSDAFARQCMGLLFPHFAESALSPEEALSQVSASLSGALNDLREIYPEASRDAEREFRSAIPLVHQQLLQDAEAFYANDPAAESVDEVILAYPGFYAVAIHRLAHVLYQAGVPLLPRLLGEHAHRQTGVDIHPGAQIGRSFFIDHGTGVVVGETAIIGDRVKIYQGVTLGAHHVHKRLSGTKRHPTIEDDVVIYSHATILGGDTVIGADSVVGGNSWVTRSVPRNSVVSHRNSVRHGAHTNVDEVIDFNI